MAKLKLVLCWHMHQPEYRDLQSGTYKLPWTYLHVIKDYVDMAGHLEAAPEAKAVINFAPVLLEQIEDYARQISAYLEGRNNLNDPFLAALVNPDAPTDPDDQLKLIKDCLRANRERQINRYPAFKKLADMAAWLELNYEALGYITPQFIFDLIVWYHLAWMGETIKIADNRIRHLIEKGGNYSIHDRRELLQIIGDQLTSIIHRYQSLARRGQVELSVTPYAHPIMPLLIDLNSALEAMPDAGMPELKRYPDGENRVKWHVEKGIQTFNRFFGFNPSGCWPSEGSISSKTIKILEDAGFKWTASGGTVLRNSLNLLNNPQPGNIHCPFKLESTQVACFFRDDGLSDRIGFEYSKWHADDAVGDFIKHLETIAENLESGSVVSVIMDGENAWEYYPDNGYHFLSALYRRLTVHPDIDLTTFSEFLASTNNIKTLEKLVAGSWVYGTFSTWIGDMDKNRAWDMLGDAKRAFDAAVSDRKLNEDSLQRAELQLAICEGSDWFWWFGDYNPGETVSNFEKQFRLNLSNLYRLIGQDEPGYLSLSFTQGFGAPDMGGTMRQSQ